VVQSLKRRFENRCSFQGDHRVESLDSEGNLRKSLKTLRVGIFGSRIKIRSCFVRTVGKEARDVWKQRLLLSTPEELREASRSDQTVWLVRPLWMAAQLQPEVVWGERLKQVTPRILESRRLDRGPESIPYALTGVGLTTRLKPFSRLQEPQHSPNREIRDASRIPCRQLVSSLWR
jgi:hypothetical protein